MSSNIEIVVGDVTDVEARVIARYCGSATGVVLSGSLRGPFCDQARTLPAEFEFRDFGNSNGAQIETIVPDPCMWTSELPHLYQADIEARQGEQLVAEYHGTIGLRRLAPRRPVDFAPGTG
jgi:beta-galactosidase/beta-glucuronidase